MPSAPHWRRYWYRTLITRVLHDVVDLVIRDALKTKKWPAHVNDVSGVDIKTDIEDDAHKDFLPRCAWDEEGKKQESSVYSQLDSAFVPAANHPRAAISSRDIKAVSASIAPLTVITSLPALLSGLFLSSLTPCRKKRLEGRCLRIMTRGIPV